MSVDPAPVPSRYARIGKYQVQAHLATGGMGAVYRAVDPASGRVVALKVLPTDLAARPEVLERFRREARHGLKLSHENIVTLYEFGEAEGTYYLAMEFVDGIDLHEHIKRHGRLDPVEACEVLLQVARALDHAYQAGIIHRDIKPSNVLLCRKDGRRVAKLADLGLAIPVRDEEFRITRDGSTVGTIDYISPEQARDSRAVDIRSDLYSLGCTWFHMLAGMPPFAQGSLPERLIKHAEAEPPDVQQFNPRVTGGLVAILQRLLAKKPEDRYQTPADLIKDLTWEMAGLAPPTTARPPDTGSSRAAADHTPDTAHHLAAASAPAASRPVPGAAGNDTPWGGVPAGAAEPVWQGSAAQQFKRANQLLAAGDGPAAIPLLRLLPARSVQRRVSANASAGPADEQRNGLNVLVAGSADGTARQDSAPAACCAGNLARVLEYGEQVLGRDPGDLGTHLLMAEAAEDLGLQVLAVWLLKQARHEDKTQVTINGAMADYYERHNDVKRAITFWQAVCEAAPENIEASHRLKDLLARATIARTLHDKGHPGPSSRRRRPKQE